MEATQVPINRQLDKEEVEHIYNEVLLSYKKYEILPFATTWMDIENILLSKVSQTEETNTIWFY